MLYRQFFGVHPQARFGFGAMTRALSAPDSPRLNHLLAALPLKDYQRLLPDLEPVSLPPGCSVYGAGDRQQYLYFVTSGIVAWCYGTEQGAWAAFAVTGSEGVIGIASFLGGKSMSTQTIVQSAGYAYRLGADLLKKEFEHDGPLQQLLLRYMTMLLLQIGQVAVCNRHHSLEQRLCRWILECLDRSPANELTMTHDVLAEMLGVRREGITQAAGRLRDLGLIDYRRGHITVVDRSRLEAEACECYAVVKREHGRLLHPETTIGNAGEHVHEDLAISETLSASVAGRDRRDPLTLVKHCSIN